MRRRLRQRGKSGIPFLISPLPVFHFTLPLRSRAYGCGQNLAEMQETDNHQRTERQEGREGEIGSSGSEDERKKVTAHEEGASLPFSPCVTRQADECRDKEGPRRSMDRSLACILVHWVRGLHVLTNLSPISFNSPSTPFLVSSREDQLRDS